MNSKHSRTARCILVLFLWLGVAGTRPTMARSTGPAASPTVTPGESAFERDAPAWRIRWELARILSYDHQYDEAIRQYQRVLEKQPGRHEIRLEMARVMYWDGRIGEASSTLGDLPRHLLGPEEEVILAELYTAQGLFPAALEIYDAQIKKDPENDPVRLRRAETLSWMEQHDDSLAEFETLLARHPDDIYLRRRYAEVLHWAGRHREAAEQLRQTLPD